jgi:hypothetical protein
VEAHKLFQQRSNGVVARDCTRADKFATMKWPGTRTENLGDLPYGKKISRPLAQFLVSLWPRNDHLRQMGK